MDRKRKKYGRIIASWLQEYASPLDSAYPGEYALVTDHEHYHYQVISSYWLRDEFHHLVLFHLQIKPNGKVWLLVNNTDSLVFDDLMERGIPRDDLVIGFLPETLRPYSGFAVA
jgi:hypothetical protein